MVYLPSWIRRLMFCLASVFVLIGMAGCDQTRPEKFAGFASEQLSEQIEIVSAKLNESIEENQQSQSEILRAVKDLSEVVAGMKMASMKEVEELKKVSGKVKTKLTSAGDEKKDVATLDPNAAPSAKLQLDSLDDAAEQIEALAKRVDELEKRSKTMASSATSAPSGNSSGSMRSTFSGNSSGSSVQSYQSYSAPVYSEVTYSQPVYSQPTYSAPVVQPAYQSTVSSNCYKDPSTGQWVCDKNVQQSSVQQYRTGLLGRKISVR